MVTNITERKISTPTYILYVIKKFENLNILNSNWFLRHWKVTLICLLIESTIINIYISVLGHSATTWIGLKSYIWKLIWIDASISMVYIQCLMLMLNVELLLFTGTCTFLLIWCEVIASRHFYIGLVGLSIFWSVPKMYASPSMLTF